MIDHISIIATGDRNCGVGVSMVFTWRKHVPNQKARFQFQFPRNFIIIMDPSSRDKVTFYGYLLGKERLYWQGVDLGHPRPTTVENSMEIISLASRDVRTDGRLPLRKTSSL